MVARKLLILSLGSAVRGWPKSSVQVVDRGTNSGVGIDCGTDSVDGVNDGAVVASADTATDLGQAVGSQLAGHVHRDLPRLGDVGPPIAGENGLSFDPELAGRRVEYLRDAGLSGDFVLAQSLQDVAGELGRGGLSLKRRIGNNADQRALERPDAAADACGGPPESPVGDRLPGCRARPRAPT